MQWMILGIIAGLMMNVYYANAILLLLPLLKSLALYRKDFGTAAVEPVNRLFPKNPLFAAVTLAAFLSTPVTKKIIYGSYLNFGYAEHWYWTTPALLKVCFSSEHGLFTWTPVLIPAVTGLFSLRKYDRQPDLYLIAVFGAYLYAIGCYENWKGIASFGNRFFCFPDGTVHIRFGGFFRLAGARLAGEPGHRLRLWHNGNIDRLEPRAHLPVGHAPDPSARSDFLARCSF